MNSKVSDMVVALAQGKASTAQESFSGALAEKINAALDERKASLASELYNKKQTPEVK